MQTYPGLMTFFYQFFLHFKEGKIWCFVLSLVTVRRFSIWFSGVADISCREKRKLPLKTVQDCVRSTLVHCCRDHTYVCSCIAEVSLSLNRDSLLSSVIRLLLLSSPLQSYDNLDILCHSYTVTQLYHDHRVNFANRFHIL